MYRKYWSAFCADSRNDPAQRWQRRRRFSRTAISQFHNIGTTNICRSATPTPLGSSTPVSQAPTVGISLWKEQGATHKVTHKRVSVQTLDKRVEMEGFGPYPWYGRLLLDCYIVLMIRVLEEMVEPLEEMRTELIFATEPILSSLQLLIPWNSHHTPIVELDEIEV